jgi:hypothetical protein
MASYEAAVTTTIVTATAGAVLGAFHAGARPARITEIELFNITAPTTSGGIGLCRSTALGTGALTGQLGQATDPSNDVAALATVVASWATTAPTVAASPFNTFRRWSSPASFGNGVIWTWPSDDPMVVPANSAVNSELCIINLQGTAPGTYFFVVRWKEG